MTMPLVDELIVELPEGPVDIIAIAKLLGSDMSHEQIAEQLGVMLAAVRAVGMHPYLRYLQGKGAPPCPEVERPDEEYTYVDDSDW